MQQIAFTLLFAAVLASALGVVLSKNAVNGAMCLLVCLGAVEGLFVQLHAYLLAFILLWVYAGAVVALFLFIIMLLDMQGGKRWRLGPTQGVVGFVAAAVLVSGLNLLATRGRLGSGPALEKSVGSSLNLYAYQLFTTYLLPVQIIGFLLLIAMLGVIVLSRRTGAKEEGA